MTDDSPLGDLDPDDPRQPSQQIANVLRAAILTRKIEPGERLPSQPDLAARYGVARETIKRALDILSAERLIVRRQGSGTFARAQIQRPIELRPHIEAAFEAERVSLDFAGFSGETFRDAVGESLDKVRAGRLRPQSIRIRMLVVDTTQPTTLPVALHAEDGASVHERAARTLRRSIDSITENVLELADLGLVSSATVEVKTQGAGSLFKAYILNESEVFFGFYPAVERTVRIGENQVPIFDLLGKDVPLFHFTASEEEDTQGSQFVNATRAWFESIWSTIARQMPS